MSTDPLYCFENESAEEVARKMGDWWVRRLPVVKQDKRLIGMVSLAVATWIEAGTRELAAPSVKQWLAAIRHLFDWLVTGQVVPVNPAASVRGPRHVVTSGQTPVFDPAEARALLDSIDTSTVVGLRDRALIGLMVYSFARIGAALGMAVEDVFTQNRRLWVRLHEKGGKRHAMPCHHNLEEYLTGQSRRRRPARRCQRAAVPDDRPRHRQAHAHGPSASTRLCDDRAPRGRGRHRHQARQPQFPGHRDHCLSQERRNAGKGRGHGKPCLDAYDAALRSSARRAQPR
jgi:integrase